MRGEAARRESLGLPALVALLLAVATGIWVALAFAYPDLQSRYLAGSVLGAIGSFFGVLAFAALVYTIVLQKKVLERLGQQAFETMLIQLIGFHHEIIGEIHYRRSNVIFKGREAIRQLTEMLDDIVNVQQPEEVDTPDIRVVRRLYKQFYDLSGAHLAHYFRSLYHIIKYIDQSSDIDARQYTSLVRAQLSPSELQLLFYAGLSEQGEKFKPLIERYSLLEQLPENQPAIANRRELYEPSAYGRPGA